MTAEEGFRYVDPEPPRFEGNQAWDAWKRRRDAFLSKQSDQRPAEIAAQAISIEIPTETATLVPVIMSPCPECDGGKIFDGVEDQDCPDCGGAAVVNEGVES